MWQVGSLFFYLQFSAEYRIVILVKLVFMKTYEEWEQIRNDPNYSVEQITDYLVDRLSAAELLVTP